MRPFTAYEVDELVAATKIAGKILQNTLRGDKQGRSTPSVKEIRFAVRKKDSPNVDLVLILSGRIKVKKLTGVASIHKPGVALLWHGKRIRGVDWKIRHEVIQSGVVTGFVKGWHEHICTDQDEDGFIVPVDPKMKNEDLQ